MVDVSVACLEMVKALANKHYVFSFTCLQAKLQFPTQLS